MDAVALADLAGPLSEERPPLYAGLARRLRLLVGDGRLAVGVRLPPERDLASALHVSRATVTAAYGLLREDGWAVARQGAGTWTRLPAGPESGGTWLPLPPDSALIDLAHAAPVGAPPQVTAALHAALAELPRLLPTHGIYPQGLPELRARLAERYTARGLPTAPEQILITGGALQGCALALSVLAGAGDRVLVEHPTYPHVADAIVAQGSLLVPVPVDAGAPDGVVADLTRVARQTGPRAAYLMPDFQNPTGLLLEAEQRSRLAAGLQQYGVTAVIDETLVDLGLDRQPPAPFAAFAKADAVVTAGSASKAFWGGLRIGWLRAEAPLIDVLGAALGRTQMGTPVLEQLAVCHLLDQGQAVLGPVRERLRTQRAVLLEELARHLPSWQVRVPEGGLVLWCRLPSASSSALVSAAGELGLRLAAGSRFGSGHAFEQWIRLPYTQPVDVLRRAVPLLAAAAHGAPGRAARLQPALLV